MNQEIRNKLRNVVTQCRTLLEKDIRTSLEGKFRIYEKNGEVVADPKAPMGHLEEDKEREARAELLDHLNHIKARGFKPKEALDQLVREIAFTHLNRFCAFKMMKARDVYIDGEKFRDAVNSGVNSNGVMFYLADHPDDERLFKTGKQYVAYRHYLNWLGGTLSSEIGVLFNPNDPANRLYPGQTTLAGILELLNEGAITPEETKLRGEWPHIWEQDETIGWVYQYFTPKEMRDKARSESRSPSNSNELAFRNQFFTPRYVVEFLADNSLGRIWYEMRKGVTKLKDQCRYMVRRPTEVFIKEGEQPPKESSANRDDPSQEDLLKHPVHIPHRPKKDPRELTILDPACGSGHFLLYCFDLLLTIYEEAYTDPDLGPALKKDYPTLDTLKPDMPRLILAHNLHGIDIDLRASQIAALALWLRCQRAYQEMGLKKDRPKITRSNLVCAEPMPGESQMLREFVGQLEPKVLGQVVEVVFDKMKLAGEAGTLLKIEDEIRDTIREAKRQYDMGGIPIQQTLFDKPVEPGKKRFSVQDLPNDEFFERAESTVAAALKTYAEGAGNGHRLQRRLFAEDAAQGFSFIELCHRRFDVVLMNPPFGMLSKNAKTYVEQSYAQSKGDILAHFVERALELCASDGYVGAISSRSCFYLGRLTKFRQNVLREMSRLVCMADFGEGVLDATVETASYILSRKHDVRMASVFFRQLLSSSKDSDLRLSVEAVAEGQRDSNTFLADTASFDLIINSPYAYWVPPATIAKLKAFPPIEGNVATVRVGLQTGEDARFLRLIWEVPTQAIGAIHDRHYESRDKFVAALRSMFRNGRRWAFYSKTDYASPWLSPIMLALDWENDGDKLKEHIRQRGYSPSKWVQSEDKYFLPGFSYMLRSTRVVPYVVPPGVIPTAGRSQVYAEAGHEIKTLAICASRIGSAVARFSGECFARPKFQASMVQNIPALPVGDATERELRTVIDTAIASTRRL